MNKESSDARAMLITMMRTYQTKTVKETGYKLAAMRNEVKQTLQTGKNLDGKAVTLSKKKELRKLLVHYRSELQQLIVANKVYKEGKENQQ